MAWNGLSVLAVVPARGGSKGIPRKNLARVGGRSLIAWAAHTIAELPWIDAAVLSTDDEEMVEEGRRCGLSVPFLRPDQYATDLASSVGMWQDAWLKSEAHFDQRFDVSVLLQPTTPLRRSEDVRRCVEAVVEGGHRAATTISAMPGHYVPEKCLLRDHGGRIQFFWDSVAGGGGAVSRRQDAKSYFIRNGICYALTRSTLVDDGHIVEDDCAGVVVDGFVVNIDEPIELELAEFMFQRSQPKNENENEIEPS
ncbi:MAG: acylneuraminate cytidylyltransferase family protein [Planctomycetota bacterium]